MTDFPPPVWKFHVQHDGVAVVAGERSMYRSQGDFRHWSETTLEIGSPPRYINLRPVGGEGRRFFFLAKQVQDVFPAWHLLSVTAAGKAASLRKIPTDAAAFTSADVGAVGVQFSVLLTTDGGATWHHAARLDGKSEAVSALVWLGPSRLLVGGDRGSVQLMERDGEDKLRRLWATTLDRESVVRFLPDGDYVWVRAPGWSLHRIAVADGHEDAAILSDIDIQGLAVCHERLLIWDWPGFERGEPGPDGQLRERQPSIRVWGRKADGLGYEPKAKIPLPAVNGDSPALSAIFPEKSPQCLAVSVKGKAFSLDLEKKGLAPTDLDVTPALDRKPPVDPAQATEQQIIALYALARKVSQAEGDAVFEEMDKKTGLTDRQQVEWAIQELQRIIDAKKAKRPEK